MFDFKKKKILGILIKKFIIYNYLLLFLSFDVFLKNF